MEQQIIAIDLGASSGKVFAATYQNDSITLQEIHRFPNNPVMLNETFHWDFLHLFHEIQIGLTKASAQGSFASIGVDSWGNDFGFVDKYGNLLLNPIHYRDQATGSLMEPLLKEVGKEALYQTTGIQFMRYNGLFRLAYLSKINPELMGIVSHALLIPDLFNYYLTGTIQAEYTNASTTQLIHALTKDWHWSLLDQLGIPKTIMPPVKKPGTFCGYLKESLCKQLQLPSTPVLSVASHDTASAVMGVPAEPSDFAYISSGTWSLLGTELSSPLITTASQIHNFTNEGGYDNTIRFLKNIMGLWLIQESKRQWEREGQCVSYAQLEQEALSAPPFQSFIDPDDDRFGLPGNIPLRVQEYCKETHQSIPRHRGEIMRCIYESLALKYNYVYQELEQCTQKKYSILHIVGGGTKDTLLCQMTANSCGIPVMAGPIEASALGNVVVQLLTLGQIPDVPAARDILRRSFTPVLYQPQEVTAWQQAYQRFCQII